ncbi:hypothetical protein ALC60_09675, partial [Trachymyrmex zeteki]
IVSSLDNRGIRKVLDEVPESRLPSFPSDRAKNLYGETFSHCSAVAFRGPSDSFTGYLNRFEVSKRFGRAVRTAATDLALTRLYLDS